MCEHLIIKGQKHLVEAFKSIADMGNYIGNIVEETNEDIKNFMTSRKEYLINHRSCVKNQFS